MNFPKLFDFDKIKSVELRPAATHSSLLSELNKSYKHIAKKIEVTWGTRECEEYLTKITLDDRGDRQGFPPEVFILIFKLSQIHSNTFDFTNEADRWQINNLK